MKLDPKHHLITGYPKAGNTWLHVMISYILNPQEMKIGHARMPDTKIFTHCIPRFNQVKDNNMKIKVPGLLRDKKVILLVRHPGDILVSLYMHNRYREKTILYNGTINEMVIDPIYGLHKILKYYQWWIDNIHEPQTCYIIRYESLLANTYMTLAKALDYTDIDTDNQLIKQAIQFSTFKRMQHMERTNYLGWPSLHMPHTIRIEGRKVRKGTINQYKTVFNSETVNYIKTHVKSLMPSIYGYSL